MARKLSLLIILTVFLHGCSYKPDIQTKIHRQSGVTLVESNNYVKIAYLKEYDSRIKLCASREGDADETSRSSFGIGVSAAKTSSERIDSQLGTGAISLGGRNPEVLIARELLFRACELSLNINADREATIKIYNRFLESIERISKFQTTKGSPSYSGTGASSANSTSTRTPGM